MRADESDGTQEAPAADAAAADPAPPASAAEADPRALRLHEVERALAPLRRGLAYARRPGAAARFVEPTATAWLLKALRLELPDPVRELLASARGALLGVDAMEPEARSARIGQAEALVARVDALLGLPLAHLPIRRARPRVVPAFQRPLPAQAAEDEAQAPLAAAAAPGAGESGPEVGGRRRRKGADRVPSVDAVAQPAPAPAPAPELPVEAPPQRSRGPFPLGEGPTGAGLEERGLPEAWVAALVEEGIACHADLLTTPPSDTEVLRPVHGAGLELPEGRVAVGGRVKVRLTRLGPAGPIRHEAFVRGAGPLWIAFDGLLPAEDLAALDPGARVLAVGRRVDAGVVGPQLVEVELAADGGNRAAVLPGWPGVPGVIGRAVQRRLAADCADLLDPLPPELRARRDLLPLGEALSAVHGGLAARKEGWHRLAFDEALFAQLGLALKHGAEPNARGVAHSLVHGMSSRLAASREVELSDELLRALEDIKRDLRRARPMRRVVLGRPGDDRGLVALLASVMVAEGKSQVLWLLPEPATAEALFTFHEPLLRELGLVARLLDDEPSRAQRDALRRGEVHLAFGTHNLSAADLEFRRLGLVVVREREALEVAPDRFSSPKAPQPDLLVLPERLVGAGHLLGAYGGFDVSRVGLEKEPRPRVHLVPESERAAAYARVHEAIGRGRQVLIAMPMGRAGDLLVPDEAIAARGWVEAALPGARVQVFHGALSREERNRRYSDFQRRRFEVLLATHAAEHGPPCPGATELVVEQADRMPAVRLARLVRRLRGMPDATVTLVHADEPDPAGMEVLQRMVRGRLDEALIGEPPVLEEPRLRWIDPGRDVDLLLAARDEARRILLDDPQLRRGAAGEVGRALAAAWSNLFDDECPIAPEGGGAGRRRRRRRRKR